MVVASPRLEDLLTSVVVVVVEDQRQYYLAMRQWRDREWNEKETKECKVGVEAKN